MHWVGFYSYKGGVGRSTALWNVATRLATNKQQRRPVVMIDFDFEAPGLHYWAGGEPPARSVYELLVSLGLKARDSHDDSRRAFSYDAHAWAKRHEFSEEGLKEEMRACFRNAMRHVKDYESLFVIPCLGESASEADEAIRGHAIDWDALFAGAEGPSLADEALRPSPGARVMRVFRDTLEATVRERLSKGEPEKTYVLLDMRTGRTQSSHFLAPYLCDAVVACSSLHQQSIVGVLSYLDFVKQFRKERVAVISPWVPSTGDPGNASDRFVEAREHFVDAVADAQTFARIHDGTVKQRERLRNRIAKDRFVTIPYDARIARKEATIPDTGADVGAEGAFTRLTKAVMDTHPAEIKTAAYRFEEAGEVVSEFVPHRDLHIERLRRDMHVNGDGPSIRNRVVLFGGLATKLRQLPQEYAAWVRATEGYLDICVEGEESTRSRVIASDAFARNDPGVGQAQHYSRKFKEAQVLYEAIASSLDSNDQARVSLIQLELPLTQYVMVADGAIYVSPLFEKRSSESSSLRLHPDTRSAFWTQLLEFMIYHLQRSRSLKPHAQAHNNLIEYLNIQLQADREKDEENAS